MQITIRLFGPEAKAVGQRQISLDVERIPLTCAQLRQQLALAQPLLARSLKTGRLAVNSEFVTDDALVGAQDEVALIGSVSGG